MLAALANANADTGEDVAEEVWYNADGQPVQVQVRYDNVPKWEPSWVVREREQAERYWQGTARPRVYRYSNYDGWYGYGWWPYQGRCWFAADSWCRPRFSGTRLFLRSGDFTFRYGGGWCGPRTSSIVIRR